MTMDQGLLDWLASDGEAEVYGPPLPPNYRHSFWAPENGNLQVVLMAGAVIVGGFFIWKAL